MTPWQQRIRELRSLGIRYDEIARRTGLAYSSVGSIASGDSAAPTGDPCIRLHLFHLSMMAQNGAASSVPPVVLLDVPRADGKEFFSERQNRRASVEGTRRASAVRKARASVA